MEFGLLGLLLLGLVGGAMIGFSGGETEVLNLIEGTDEDDIIDGTAESDAIFARDGYDTVEGHEGDDEIHAGDGGGQFYGGAGGDTIDASATTEPLAGEGSPHLSYNTLVGGDGNDTLIGGDTTDYLYAEGPDDMDTTEWSEELLSVWFDNDEESASDVLEGNGGRDYLLFNAGDTATGGEGTDFFYAMDAYTTAEIGDPTVITDFETADERIYLYGEGVAWMSGDDVSWITVGDDVEVQVGGETVVIVRGAAEGFSDSNLPNITPTA